MDEQTIAFETGIDPLLSKLKLNLFVKLFDKLKLMNGIYCASYKAIAFNIIEKRVSY